jgi:hypothetical protein
LKDSKPPYLEYESSCILINCSSSKEWQQLTGISRIQLEFFNQSFGISARTISEHDDQVTCTISWPPK